MVLTPSLNLLWIKSNFICDGHAETFQKDHYRCLPEHNSKLIWIQRNQKCLHKADLITRLHRNDIQSPYILIYSRNIFQLFSHEKLVKIHDKTLLSLFSTLFSRRRQTWNIFLSTVALFRHSRASIFWQDWLSQISVSWYIVVVFQKGW